VKAGSIRPSQRGYFTNTHWSATPVPDSFEDIEEEARIAAHVAAEAEKDEKGTHGNTIET
jgi:hypothetical protein